MRNPGKACGFFAPMFLRSLLLLVSFAVPLFAAAPPNIVYILCDDLGYGDVQCLNPEGKILTPHADRLAREGMIFTDAHTSSAVCTPTRYGLLTGRYNWRSRLQTGVLGGLSPRLIEPGRMTVASLLKQHGYHTACIGKWHLGMDWVKHPGGEVSELSIEKPNQVGSVDYVQPISNGPTTVGFDYYFGISASLDMVPYVFIENDRVNAAPTGEAAYPMTLGRDPDKTTRKGPAAPDFTAGGVLPALTGKAVEYIGQRASDAKAGKPFFLYLPLASPHTPIAPTPAWQGKSGISPYADFVMQTDATLGTVMSALEKHGLAENTLVVFTSDNGCSPQANFPELAAKGHNPSAQFRGHKADIFEAGHRVPFIVRWPAKVKAGSISDQLICLTDLLATSAEIVGTKLPENAGEDSVSILPALTGQASQSLREAVVHHSINGSFAVRRGPWKLILTSSSGGWSDPRPNTPAAKALPSVQLYDLSSDAAERNNLEAQQPEVVARLTKLLERYVAEGRSTAGEAQANAVPIELWKDRVVSPAKPAKAAN
jgi:arylsulfatase A